MAKNTEQTPEVSLPVKAKPEFNKSFIASLTKRMNKDSDKKVSTEDVRGALMAQMREAEYDPIQSLIDKVQHGVPVEVCVDGASEIQRIPLEPKDMIKIELALIEYLVPKLKSVETKQELDLNINVQVNKFGDGKPVESIDMTDTGAKIIDAEVIDE